jgi:threonine synthase
MKQGKAGGNTGPLDKIRLPPVSRSQDSLSLGEGATPLIASRDDASLLLKLEFLNPTGSFKDRGAARSVAAAAARGARHVVVDSSGNAGAAIAAYAARAGLRCDVFVPSGNTRSKLRQAEAYGAVLHSISGGREAARDAALDYVHACDATYLSHAHDDAFVDGVAECFMEIFEACSELQPQRLYLPAGHGTLVIGAMRAMEWLAAQCRLKRWSEIIAVQSARCAPLARALGMEVPVYDEGSGEDTPEGVLIAEPPRLASMVEAVKRSKGSVRVLQDQSVASARRRLCAQGLLVEPSGALGYAAALIDRAAGASGLAVAPLCGSGLKTLPSAA